MLSCVAALYHLQSRGQLMEASSAEQASARLMAQANELEGAMDAARRRVQEHEAEQQRALVAAEQLDQVRLLAA